MYSENWKNEKKKLEKNFGENSAGASPKDDWKKLTGLKNEDKSMSMWHATNKMKFNLTH